MLKFDYKIESCPFCGGNAKLSYKQYKFYGQNFKGDKKISYRVQVICNKCRSRGKPIVTEPLINPDPYARYTIIPNFNSWLKKQRELFQKYTDLAVNAWNDRKYNYNE